MPLPVQSRYRSRQLDGKKPLAARGLRGQPRGPRCFLIAAACLPRRKLAKAHGRRARFATPLRDYRITLLRSDPGNNSLFQERLMIGVVKSKFIAGSRSDPIHILRTMRRICEQHLFTAISRNIDLSIHALPGNRSFAKRVADGYWIWRST